MFEDDKEISDNSNPLVHNPMLVCLGKEERGPNLSEHGPFGGKFRTFEMTPNVYSRRQFQAVTFSGGRSGHGIQLLVCMAEERLARVIEDVN